MSYGCHFILSDDFCAFGRQFIIKAGTSRSRSRSAICSVQRRFGLTVSVYLCKGRLCQVRGGRLREKRWTCTDGWQGPWTPPAGRAASDLWTPSDVILTLILCVLRQFCPWNTPQAIKSLYSTVAVTGWLVAVLAQSTAVTAPALFDSVACVMYGGRWLLKCT
jgi:hypothetical protein